jgi:hypothetical protein
VVAKLLKKSSALLSVGDHHLVRKRLEFDRISLSVISFNNILQNLRVRLP